MIFVDLVGRLAMLWHRVFIALALGALFGGGVAAAAQSFTSKLPVMRPNTSPAQAEALSARSVLDEPPVFIAGVDDLLRSPHPIVRPADLYKRAMPSGSDLVTASGVSGITSYAVADLSADAHGVSLEVREPLRRLPPASVAKAITAIYALEALGGDFRFSTEVLATGPIVNGIVQGDIIMAGSGDPTLDTDGLASLASLLRSAGVTGITGSFYVYADALPRIEQIDDEQTEYAGYNPTITGLNVNYNRVHFEWRKQGADYSLQMDARTDNRAPQVKIARMRIADRGLPVFDHTNGAGRDEWTVSRSALGNAGSRWLPVRVPALYAGELFVTLANGQGVRLPAAKVLRQLPQGTSVLTQLQSVPLTVIARDMLKYSTNLTADVLGLTASLKRGSTAVDLASSAQAMSEWAKTRLGARHLNFVDHSGLGGASVVSTSDLVNMLAAPGVEPLLAPILKPIAVLDTDRNLMKDTGISIAAKTGTLDFVSTLAGYLTAPDGRRMAFAIFSGDVPKRSAAKAAGEAIPKGARTFNTRAKKLQQVLLQRWAGFYGS